MGVSRWLVSGQRAAGYVLASIFFCAAYPVYTLGLRCVVIGLAGNIVTAAMAWWVVMETFRISRWATALVGCVVVWVSYASYFTFLAMRVHA